MLRPNKSILLMMGVTVLDISHVLSTAVFLARGNTGKACQW
jgi:hypothetical protein